MRKSLKADGSYWATATWMNVKSGKVCGGSRVQWNEDDAHAGRTTQMDQAIMPGPFA
ncbi:hypothetical protein SAMN04487895_102206 [Paenibacillus sophorae]|uniref:Uncharacterized protein n=1 Tax=Paenibacillus sophorae TaxID=1333845 RepID=A0A1H8IHZ0_9BACL|nr:hypothetical protein [Paenibacillus sophorae]QWU15972.1 hypothetical protein KP014_01430 [Paenibacillus sophorae]SEN68134.1 hypothetical protein SAMN04487895_102206 [Paenibacillus sophorae]